MILNDGQCQIETDEIHGYVAWQHEPCLLRVISSSIKRRAMTWNVPEPKTASETFETMLWWHQGEFAGWYGLTTFKVTEQEVEWWRGRRGYTTIGLPGRGLAWVSLVKLRIYSDTTGISILGKPARQILWSLILEPTKGMCCLRQRQMGCPDTDSSQNLPKTLLAGRVAALVPSSQS